MNYKINMFNSEIFVFLCTMGANMSILNVENMTQGFGDKIIFNNVNFKLEKNEHIGLVGAKEQGSFGKDVTRKTRYFVA